MSTVALFHSSHGVIDGIRDAERRLAAAGHTVRIVDYYGGRTFPTYEAADKYVTEIGFPALMENALAGVSDLADGFIATGFSNGGGMATYVALHRNLTAVVLCSGALPLHMIGAEAWPSGVPAQLHYMADDARKVEGSVESVMRSINQAGADAEYVQYPGNGHLFTDPSMHGEYDADATDRFWHRVLEFCARNDDRYRRLQTASRA
jgi:dienelactone hydrolase